MLSLSANIYRPPLIELLNFHNNHKKERNYIIKSAGNIKRDGNIKYGHHNCTKNVRCATLAMGHQRDQLYLCGHQVMNCVSVVTT